LYFEGSANIFISVTLFTHRVMKDNITNFWVDLLWGKQDEQDKIIQD
jgi:hypothetical protein